MEWFKKLVEDIRTFFQELNLRKHVDKVKSLNLIQFARELRHWVQNNYRSVLIALGAVVVLVIGTVIYLDSLKNKNNEAAGYFSYGFNNYSAAMQGRGNQEQLSRMIWEAQRAFSEVLTRFPNSPVAAESLFYQANIAYLTADYAKALEQYSLYVKKYGKRYLGPFAQESIGYCHEQMGDLNAAIKAYEEVKRKFPRSSIAGRTGLNVGRCYESLNDFQKAFEAYQSVLAYDPNSQWARNAQVRLAFLESKYQYEQSINQRK
jgi:tetratricopeptide (TPR) repeat protein